jgi:hypothetical protein
VGTSYKVASAPCLASELTTSYEARGGTGPDRRNRSADAAQLARRGWSTIMNPPFARRLWCRARLPYPLLPLRSAGAASVQYPRVGLGCDQGGGTPWVCQSSRVQVVGSVASSHGASRRGGERSSGVSQELTGARRCIASPHRACRLRYRSGDQCG